MKTLHNQGESSRKALFRNIKNIQASPSNNKITLTMYKKKEKEIVRKHTRYKLFNVVVPFARLYNKCNKIRQQTDGVMGGTPLRDRRGGRLP